jgi:hypothetical protein
MKVSDLTYNMAALREFKKLTGVSPFVSDLTDPDVFSALAYVGLKQGKYKDLGKTQDDVDEELTYNDTPIISKAFNLSWQKLSDSAEGDEDEDKKK